MEALASAQCFAHGWSTKIKIMTFLYLANFVLGILQQHVETIATVFASTRETSEEPSTRPRVYDNTKTPQEWFKSLIDSLDSLSHLFDGLCDREFFVTENGYAGLTNGYVEEGGVAVLLPDLDMPVLLRRDDSNDGYRFVGGAYVDGMVPQMCNYFDKPVLGDQERETIWDNLEGKDLTSST